MAVRKLEQHDALALPMADIGDVVVGHPGQDLVIQPDFGGCHELQGNAFGIEGVLKLLRGEADIGGPVLVAPGVYVGRYNRNTYPGGNRMAGQAQCRQQIFGTIVDPGEQMAMKVNHARLEE